MKLNTRRIGKELTMVSVEILIRFLIFSYILIPLPGAGFLAFSIYALLDRRIYSRQPRQVKT